MKRYTISIVLCVFSAAILSAGCAVPRMLFHQKDLPRAELKGSPGGHIVLVASRSSEFKRALADALGEALVAKGVTMRTVGVDDLQEVDAADYDAVVVVSTCVAWGLAPEVQAFLDGQSKRANIIAVTTSGDGGWLPNMEGRDFDALSSASKMSSVEALAKDVLARIEAHLLSEE